jgi:hypothetical protein
MLLRFTSTSSGKEYLLPPSPSNLRHLSVTESLNSRQKKEAVSMSIQKFNLREWLVPPISVPAFLGLLIAGAVIVRW